MNRSHRVLGAPFVLKRIIVVGGGCRNYTKHIGHRLRAMVRYYKRCYNAVVA